MKLATSLPRLRRFVPPSGTRHVVFLLALALLLPSLAGAQKVTISNPELYGKTLKAAMEALEHYGAYDNPAALKRVADIAYRLAAQSDFDQFPFTFYLVDMPEPNAFALPGGQIFVTRGMLDLGLSDDMLACLLGHELAHVVHQHGLRMQRRATLLNLVSQALVLGVLVGAEDGPENPQDPYGIERSGSRKGSLVQGTAATGLVITELLLRNYSREFEDEADVEGQRLAAAAGFDPAGAQALWNLMNARIPQTKEYGYWRTHPFSDQRMRAANVRAQELKVQTSSRPAESYRTLTQQVILDFRATQSDDALEHFLDASALTAWPTGVRAETIRLASLHEKRDAEMAKGELERDYGAMVRAYGEQLEEVRALTPDAPFLATLEREQRELRTQAEAIYPKAQDVWQSGIYQTPFLETFLSNYPEAAEVPAVALALGNAYSRLGRQADAVSQYLRAAQVDAASEASQNAQVGLRRLAPHLEELSALQELGDASSDPKLRELAHDRLAELASSYDDIANGAEYLRRYPTSEHAEPVGDRLAVLARNLYGEVLLYQAVGDHVKALDRIQKILTHAPTSQAAEQLRERAVLDS